MHIKKFNELNNERIDEGVKELIIAGALALASSGGAKAQRSNVTNQPTINREYTTTQSKSTDTSITVDFGSEFESGSYLFNQSKSKETEKKLARIADFIKSHKNLNIKIIIEGSESLVPNIDRYTGQRIPRGGLSKMRVEQTKDLIEKYMDSLLEKGLFKGTYDTLTRLGTATYYRGEDPSKQKFTREQYVRVTLKASEPTVVKKDEYAAYSKRDERVYIGGKAVGDLFYRSRSTTKKDYQGNIDTGHEDVLLRTLSPESVFAETKNPYDGKLYLIPSEWWNGEPAEDGYKRHTITNHITPEDFEYIKKNFAVKNN